MTSFRLLALVGRSCVAFVGCSLPFSCEGAMVCWDKRPQGVPEQDLCRRSPISSWSVAEFQECSGEIVAVQFTRGRRQDDALDELDGSLAWPLDLG